MEMHLELPVMGQAAELIYVRKAVSQLVQLVFPGRWFNILTELGEMVYQKQEN